MENENNDDILGLDQPLKLGRVSRIPKLTDELLFENNRGLPQIRNNYTKLLRAIRKNDRKLAEKVLKERLSKSSAHQLKVSTEVENLQKILLFYQLWCHGLFPRATFKDCLKMLRTHKSVAMREYRRGLLENEIRRLRIEKGIIVETPETEIPPEEDDLYTAPNNDIGVSSEETPVASTNPIESNNMEESDDEDWGFLSTTRLRSNNLFIGDDDDDDENDDQTGNNNSGGLTNDTSRAEEGAVSGKDNTVHNDDDDEFDNDDLVGLTSVRPATEETFPDEADFEDFADSGAPTQAKTGSDDEHDEELAIMREMGM